MTKVEYVYEVELQGDCPPFAWKLTRRMLGSSTQVDVEDAKGEADSREDALMQAQDFAVDDAANVRWRNTRETIELFRTDAASFKKVQTTHVNQEADGA